MCGIFGNFSDQSIPQEGVNHRLRMAQLALHHRGPNDFGAESFEVGRITGSYSGTLWLGHTRLSIIDLSEDARQPMHSACGRYTIVFNGEIYNYIELREQLRSEGYNFKTRSDTEVLLTAWEVWGTKALSRLVGMFAFSVYDRQSETLTLVRDAFGVKPLFYFSDGVSFSFASEARALSKLLGKQPRVNFQQTIDYLVGGNYDESEVTFFSGIKNLLPGHWLRVNLQRCENLEIVRWWWPSTYERRDISFEEAVTEVRRLFLKNIRLHLRSDVPLAAALSGGLDSSAIVCAMRYLEPDMQINTFTYVAKGSSFNEEHWADIVNKHVGAVSHKVIVSSDELANDIDDLILTQGEPFGGTSIYAQYRIYKAAREAGFTVVLDGQGADEMLAGYPNFVAAHLRSKIHTGSYLCALEFVGKWYQWTKRDKKDVMRLIFDSLAPLTLKGHARRALGYDLTPDWIDPQWLKREGVKVGHARTTIDLYPASSRCLVDMLRNSLTGKGLPSLLRHGDRNSMRWSVESRVPFLTTELAEFLLKLPESYLLSPAGETKSVFRAAMRGIVPDAILDRRDKIGFRTPEQHLLRPIRHLFERTWLESGGIPFLKHPQCTKAIRNALSAERVYKPVAWRLLNISRWLTVNKLNL